MHKYQILRMHIKLTKFFSPFLSINEQRGEDNQTIKMYMRYIFMKRRDDKLAPSAFMHYMEKE